MEVVLGLIILFLFVLWCMLKVASLYDMDMERLNNNKF